LHLIAALATWVAACRRRASKGVRCAAPAPLSGSKPQPQPQPIRALELEPEPEPEQVQVQVQVPVLGLQFVGRAVPVSRCCRCGAFRPTQPEFSGRLRAHL